MICFLTFVGPIVPGLIGQKLISLLNTSYVWHHVTQNRYVVRQNGDQVPNADFIQPTISAINQKSVRHPVPKVMAQTVIFMFLVTLTFDL